jgi:hypothetical protein
MIADTARSSLSLEGAEIHLGVLGGPVKCFTLIKLS